MTKQLNNEIKLVSKLRNVLQVKLCIKTTKQLCSSIYFYSGKQFKAWKSRLPICRTILDACLQWLNKDHNRCFRQFSVFTRAVSRTVTKVNWLTVSYSVRNYKYLGCEHILGKGRHFVLKRLTHKPLKTVTRVY